MSVHVWIISQDTSSIFHTLSTHEALYEAVCIGACGAFMVLTCIMINVSFVILVELLPFLSYVNMYNNLSSCTIIILEPFTCAIDLKALWCSLERTLKSLKLMLMTPLDISYFTPGQYITVLKKHQLDLYHFVPSI